MSIKVNRSDTIWSFVRTFFSFGSGIIILPFVMFYLGEEDLGIYYVFLSVSMISTFFDFGFNPSFSRNIAYSWSGAKSLNEEDIHSSDCGEPNFLLMAKTISACKIVYLAISCIALLLLLTIGTNYIERVTQNISDGLNMIAWMIYVTGIFLNLLFGYYTALLRGVGAIAAVNRANIISRGTQILITIILLAFDFQLIGVAIGYSTSGLLFRLIAKNEFFNYKNMKANLSGLYVKVSFSEVFNLLKTIWPNTWREGVVSLSNYMLFQAGTIIASLYLTLAETAVYGLATQITAAIAMVSATLYDTYQPSLQSSFVNRNIDKQREDLSIVVMSYIVIYLIGFSALLTVGLPIIRILKPSFQMSIPVILLVGLYQFLLKFRNCYTTYFSSTNRIIYMRSFVFSAFLSVGFSIFLAGSCNFGIWGLIFAQILSQLVFDAWYWAILAHRELNITYLDMLKYFIGEIKNVIIRYNKIRK